MIDLLLDSEVNRVSGGHVGFCKCGVPGGERAILEDPFFFDRGAQVSKYCHSECCENRGYQNFEIFVIERQSPTTYFSVNTYECGSGMTEHADMVKDLMGFFFSFKDYPRLF